MLSSGGILEPATLYPPADVASLSALLHAIENSTYDRLKKDSLVYFLLKWHQDGREAKFADERCISPQFCALCDAYWHLDTGWNVEVRTRVHREEHGSKHTFNYRELSPSSQTHGLTKTT